MGNNTIRERALAAVPPTEPVDVPEWGAKVEVRGLTLGAQQEFLRSLPDVGSKNRQKTMIVQLVLRCTFDPDTGEPVFDPADPEAMLAADSAPFNRVFQVAGRLSGLIEGDTEAELAADPTAAPS